MIAAIQSPEGGPANAGADEIAAIVAVLEAALPEAPAPAAPAAPAVSNWRRAARRDAAGAA